MEKALENLLDRAEACFIGGQLKMANNTIDEIRSRVQEKDMPNWYFTRFSRLVLMIERALRPQVLPIET